MNSEFIDELVGVARQAALAGGETLLSLRSSFQASEKGRHDFVTTADIASQQAVFEVISQHYPSHRLVGEEGNASPPVDSDDDYCWIVDPLDGTTNYLHQFPFYSVSIAVVRRGALLAGVVLDPVRNEVFWAGKGRGAWLGEVRIRVSGTQSLNESLVSMSLPPRVAPDSPDLQTFINVVQKCRAVRRTGSAALNLAYVAGGLIDGYWARQINAWDVAAGVLLVQEAGGRITNTQGGEFDLWKADLVAASTDRVVQELLAEMS